MTILAVISIYAISNSLSGIKTVNATVSGCNPRGCSYNCDCSPCKAAAGNFCPASRPNCCPVCLRPSCGDINMDNGGCPAGCGNCDERTVSCSCGNFGSIKCHKCSGTPNTPPPPPPPSSTPIPTPTSPPTPTPVQPTVVLALPLPVAGTFSDDRKSKLGQSWVCIQSIPCSQSGVSCSGGNKEHRVLIKTKDGTTLRMNGTPTYVFECISSDQISYRCTTGVDTLDQSLLSKSNLQVLKNNYGYEFVSYTDTKNVNINQSNANSVPKTTSEGAFGPYEWESKTNIQAWRLIMTMQDLDWKSGNQGEVGALQQGSLFFTNDKYNKDCVIIKWDPQGIVYDVASLLPLDGVKVTLYIKNPAGSFVLMQDEKWGLLANPINTSKQGSYQFFVPAGTYKIEVDKEGYELAMDKKGLPSAKKIRNIYDGGEIVTKGEIQEVNILMRKKSVIKSIMEMVSFFLTHEK